jgi:hypothetical protein
MNDRSRCTAEIHHTLKRAFTQLGAESCWFATGRRKFHLIPPITKCDYWPLNLVDHTQWQPLTANCCW